MEKSYSQPIFEFVNTDESNKVFFTASGGETCLVEGTQITMSDGSYKKIEEIEKGDILLTFDHEAGNISSAKVCLVWKCEEKRQPLYLSFASGKKIGVVGAHNFLLEKARTYVCLNQDNVTRFIGERFYNAETATWDALVSYEMDANPVNYYCIYSAKHLNCISEGMLTCPDDVDHILNIFKLDAGLKADTAQLTADIAQYGLFDLAREFPEYVQYKDAIEDLGGKYVYIAVGKGLVPKNYIETMKSYWSGV